MAKRKARQVTVPQTAATTCAKAAAVPSSAMTSKTTAPELPTEIWAAILMNVEDPYDLWVSCRQVSSKFKIDAERAFRVNFLPHLNIHWGYHGNDGDHISVEATIDDTQSELKSSSVSCLLRTTGPYSRPPVLPPQTMQERMVMLHNIIDWDDLSAMSHAGSWGPLRSMKAYIKCPDICDDYATDLDLPEVQLSLLPVPDPIPQNTKISQGHITFDWKVLITTFFAEEVHVRRKLADGIKATEDATLVGLHRKAKIFLRTGCPTLRWSSKPQPLSHNMSMKDQQSYMKVKSCHIEAVVSALAPDHTHLYEEAYSQRLRKAYSGIGLDPPWEAEEAITERRELRAHVRKHVRAFHKDKSDAARIAAVATAKLLWMREFGEVSFESKPSRAAPIVQPLAHVSKLELDIDDEILCDDPSDGLDDRSYIPSKSIAKKKARQKVKDECVAPGDTGHNPRSRRKKKDKRQDEDGW
ncbi:hypothetical protein HBH76_141860 [Parastagonospora nodorum]|nr:hypothetical protein HBH76_141860 [Parastagonospora nodorum]